MTEDQAAYWRNLKQQAIDGIIRIDVDLGQSIAAVIAEYITELEFQKAEAQRLDHLTGWGGLPSAQAIRQKLEFKAVAASADDPEDSAVKRLDQHISIARDQRDTFLAAIGRLHTTDQQSADPLRNGGL
ncbi:hypothetical protein [Nocardia harenae]|uniref:hypothetical protein n=1 Tax=Nocardia harenae TaxID=358707 RepID=UPI00083501AC|nr:hypothetical protein [Nocardia harenae]